MRKEKILKKSVIIISVILLIIIIICCLKLKLNLNKQLIAKNKNKEYEQYLNSEIYGTDVITLINKVIDSNETNKVKKDHKGFYINNNKNSVQIELIMITNEEKKITSTYKMETISKVGIIEFIKNFNTARFSCTKLKYHQSTGNIKYIEITQL